MIIAAIDRVWPSGGYPCVMFVRFRINLLAPLVLSLLSGFGGNALAGEQRYEPLAASVSSLIGVSVRAGQAPEPTFASDAQKTDWLEQMAAKLPTRWKPTLAERVEFLKVVRYEAQRAGLDPHLVLGLIQVESNFRRYAVSSADARGYMQVMPFWTSVIGDSKVSSLFDMRTNLRYGCAILRHYIDREKGDLFRALGRYNGSLGKARYPNKVLKAWKRWQYRPSQESMTASR